MTKENNGQEWLTAREAGSLINRSEWSIRRYAKDGLLRHSRTPGRRGRILIHRDWLNDFLQSSAVGGPETYPAAAASIDGSELAAKCPTLSNILRDGE